jgi:signal transduction histidine kinase
LGAICIATGAFAVWSLHATETRHERLDETYAASVVLAYDLRAEEDRRDALAPLFVLTGNRTFIAMIAASHDRFDAILDRLRHSSLSPDAAQRLARIAAAQARLRAAERTGEAMRLAGASARATDAYFHANVGPLASRIRQDLEVFVQDASHSYAHEKRRDLDLTHDYLMLAWAGGALALPLVAAIGYVVERSIARRRALDAVNARQVEREREISRARKAAVEIVAHDLRNPLTAVLFGAEDLLADPRMEAIPDLRERVRTISLAAAAMNRLIHNVLDQTRIEAGALVVSRRPTDLREVLDRVLAQFSEVAARRGVELSAEAARNTRAAIDADRIEQVLGNLVANALKFTPPGGRVSITAALEGDRLVLRVADTGHGIAPEDLSRIFQRYWQDRDAAHQGAGLGLSICHAIVQAHAGTIDVESRLAAGSTFTVRLPTSA